MSFLTWLIFGLMAGSIAYLISPEADFSFNGFIQVLISAVLGSILGGLLASLVLQDPITNFNFSSLLVAGFGSLLLIITPKFFNRKVN